MAAILPFLQRTSIAYFSMEIALRPEIHSYSGGLGILAGDTARSCADLELPGSLSRWPAGPGTCARRSLPTAPRLGTMIPGTRRSGRPRLRR